MLFYHFFTLIGTLFEIRNFAVDGAILHESLNLLISRDISDGFGGEPFPIQPIVAASVTGEDADPSFGFTGLFLHLVLIDNSQESPQNFKLCRNNAGVSFCDNVIVFSMVNKEIYMDGLYVDRAGDSYQIQYSLKDTNENIIDVILSSVFSVSVGTAYQIRVIVHPENAYGGSPFKTQPVVAVQDRGFNTVNSINEGTISVSMSSGDNSSILECIVESCFDVSIKNGKACFSGLFIKKKGKIHLLTFTTDLSLEGPKQCQSRQFSVGIGPPSNLIILKYTSDENEETKITGGKAFPVQPRVALADDGGNILDYDSFSAIKVGIHSNPRGGTISPPSSLVVVLTNGIAQFRSLSIDFAEEGYQLSFLLLQRNIANKLEETEIRVVGPYFNVQIGPTHNLRLVQSISKVWANNQPFLTQPRLHLIDAGQNVIIDDFSTKVKAYIVPSLAYSSQIVIHTTEDSIPQIESIKYANSTLEYARLNKFVEGDIISIEISFSQEVLVLCTDQEKESLPFLQLNVVVNSIDMIYAKATLILSKTPIQQQSRSLLFEYIVQNEHEQELLDYLSNDALDTNKCRITDLLNRDVSLELPQVNSGLSLIASSIVSIDNSFAELESINSTTPSGEYGMGEDIYFYLKFSRKVVVKGSPQIPLSIVGQRATYIDGTGTNSLKFHYTVKQNDSTTKLDVDNSNNATIYCPTNQDFISVSRSDYKPSSVSVNLSIRNLELPVDHIIAIDTSTPYILRVMPQAITTKNAVYSVGEDIFIEVQFNKPVTVYKGVQLRLDTGSTPGFAHFDYGSGTDTLVLKYTVEEGHLSSDLNYRGINALSTVDSGSGWVRRTATNLLQDAILTLPASGNSLADVSNIVIDGMRPHIVDINFDAGYVRKHYVTGDIIVINVNFSAPITLVGRPPVLNIFIDGNIREAPYMDGDGSTQLKFKYIVSVGDSCSNCAFAYKYNDQKTLCLSSNCVKEDQIFRLSSKPILLADTSVYVDNGSMETGIPIDTGINDISIDTSGAPITIVISVTPSIDNGIYGVGEIIDFIVLFSDVVYVNGVTPPTLLINFGASNLNIPYLNGTGSNILSFRHMVRFGDSTEKLDWKLVPDTQSSITCIDPFCTIMNENNINVELNFVKNGLPVVSPLTASITIDTQPPVIIDIYTTKTKSSNCIDEAVATSCTYSVGDMIPIFVKFNHPVVVLGSGPNLIIDAGGNNARKIDYDPFLSTDTDLAFVYEVEPGDSSSGTPLTYLYEDSCSLDVQDKELTYIMRKSSLPSQDAILNLPIPTSMGISSDSLNPIIIDTSRVPKVLSVSSISSDGEYSPGDVIIISVQFSEAVVVNGVPALALNIGGGNIGFAWYSVGTGTKNLEFMYSIGFNHRSLTLDYMDIHSLEAGWDGPLKGKIMQQSMNPSIAADLTLPTPGSEGSLSKNASIRIDNRIPYIISIKSPQPSGIYRTGDSILIEVHFSTPVVVDGNPYILMETGTVDRVAEYVNKIDDDSLLFSYEVQLGDKTDKLDYWTNPGLSRSASQSFQINGGSIRRKSANPTIDADVHLNPGSGFLDGTTTESVKEGVAIYKDLRIGQRGSNYKVRFQAVPESTQEILEASFDFDADLSIEYEVIGNQVDRDIGDLFGYSVDLNSDWMAIGIPHKRNPIPEVQVLSVYSEANAVENEVQVITSQLDKQSAIRVVQRFKTKAERNEIIKGSFSLSYEDVHSNMYASTIILPSDSTAEHLKVILQKELPILGNILTSRKTNLECDCENAWEWKVTFLDTSTGISLLKTGGEGLVANGAEISMAILEQAPNMLSGSFFLRNPHTNKESRNIPFDASSSMMKMVLEEDLKLSVKSVFVTNTDPHVDIPSLGRRWTITFSHHNGPFGKDINVPNLEANYEMLGGSEAVVWVHVGLEGRAPISGNFALSMRGCPFSKLIPYNATSEDVKMALESLESINEVTISMRDSIGHDTGKYGNRWKITFNSVNYLSDYGWLYDPGGETKHGNLPSLEVHDELIGWKAAFEVEYEHGSGHMDTQAQWMAKHKGDSGLQSGSVVLYKKERNQWKNEGYLKPQDFNSYDKFGHAISLDSQHLLIGAPSKEVNGLPEQQALTCYGPAASGTFVISFRGHSSNPIEFNSTIEAIKEAIVAEYGSTSKIHPLSYISITAHDAWDGKTNGFCEDVENSIVISFFTPDSGGVSTEYASGANIEAVSVDDAKLVNAKILVTETRQGTRSLAGANVDHQATGINSGAAYLFKKLSTCQLSICTFEWVQVQNFTPLNGFDVPTESSLFGWSVSSGTREEDETSILAIGSPGYNNDSGKVYLFKGSNETWSFFESLTSAVWDHVIPGDRFGQKVVVSGETILVSAPGHAKQKGSVYVFRYGNHQRNYLASQAITGPDDLQPGDFFGHSIAFIDNEAVVCAPMKTDLIKNTMGECFIYKRENDLSLFRLFQALSPSNVKIRDRFGWDIAFSGDRMIVTQVENFRGDPVPTRPVQVLRIHCHEEPCLDILNQKFRLKWRYDNVPLFSRPLDTSISAIKLKFAIENDLNTGEVSVSRTELSDADGGYSWSITFNGFGSFFTTDGKIPILECEAENSDNKPFTCGVNVEHDIPSRVRGKAHVFTKYPTGLWIEQCFLFPSALQRQDLFGASVAIDGDIAAIGATNRELLNTNSGAVVVFNIDFLDFEFDSPKYNVIEGDEVQLNISRKAATHRQFIGIKSLDKNSDKIRQDYINGLYSFKSSEVFPYAKTIIDILTHNTAMSREGNSLWIRGMFDYRAISDYHPLDEVICVEPGETGLPVTVVSTDDHIFEFPDENITVQFNMQGMFASKLGKLITTITIEDDGDGIDTNSLTTNYDKIFSKNIGSEDRFGTAVGVDETSGIIIIGSEFTEGIGIDDNKLSNVGSVYIFNNKVGLWSQNTILRPNRSTMTSEMFFGQSVAIDKAYGRDDVTVLVGAPGQAKVFVFVSQKGFDIWHEQAILEPLTDTDSTEGKFGGSRTVSLNNDLAFVGSPMSESVFVYRRIVQEDNTTWDCWTMLRSSEYDFDLYDNGFSVRHVHKQGFGMSLTSSRRSLLVGAPYADYGNQGELNKRENHNTDGIHNKGLGKGKTFMFYSQPHVQLVSLQTDEEPSVGSFRLRIRNYKGIQSALSGLIPHDSSAESFKLAIEEMTHIGEVEVQAKRLVGVDTTEGGYKMEWKITFLTEVHDYLPMLEVLWKEEGCEDCAAIKLSSLSNFDPVFKVVSISTQKTFAEEDAVQPNDVTSTDLFGYSMAMDGNLAIIGSMQSAAKTRTTWNFETGDLSGWSATGDAFDFQPTFGDNSRHRSVYEGFGDVTSESTGQPQSSLMKGRYYIGTFEHRPGRGSDGYLYPHSMYRAGNTRGDDTVGTLTSDPFLILGESISFLIGGGCNHLTEYVELLVDGYSVMRSTGKCSERMSPTIWEVNDFLNRAAQIRIVDAGKGKWGHINIDNFEFSWSVKGACSESIQGSCAEGGGALPRDNINQKQHYTGREESPMSGAAYIFKRICSELDHEYQNSCRWEEQSRLVPSDKNKGYLFGYGLSIDDTQGIAIVGSAHSPAHGLFHETPSVYPHMNPTTFDFPIPEDLENFHKNGGSFAASGGNLRVINHIERNLRGMSDNGSSFLPSADYSVETGAVYFFVRIPQKLGPDGKVERLAYWPSKDHAKISAADGHARDEFGYSIALDGVTAVVSAIGVDSGGKNAGAVYLFNTQWQRISFVQSEYVALEGKDSEVMITLHRDLMYVDTISSIGYSTSDLSARGIDKNKFSSCLDLPVDLRQECGDYEQTTGEVHFDIGESFAFFTINILDDLCHENYMEYVQLYLHIPGGGPIHGESYRAQLRIDDDDWIGRSNVVNCTSEAS